MTSSDPESLLMRFVRLGGGLRAGLQGRLRGRLQANNEKWGNKIGLQ